MRPSPAPLAVQVTHADGMWIAECAVIGLVTEAETYEALTQRVWAIAPELAALNHLDIAPDRLRPTTGITFPVPTRVKARPTANAILCQAGNSLPRACDIGLLGLTSGQPDHPGVAP
jgi:hypothetical protein